jgi:polyisoprenoid-binding protein YceI
MSETTQATRQVGGTALPAPGTWSIDPDHAEVAFIGRHFMMTKVRGRFTDVSGEVIVAEDPSQSSVDVTIGMASVSSGSTTRDDHIRSADLFDVERFPQATFVSKRVDWVAESGKVVGNLTILDVTKSVSLDVSFSGHIRDPWGNDRAIFSASTTINREDFGVTWNAALETGGVLVSKEITIEIEVETILDRD